MTYYVSSGMLNYTWSLLHYCLSYLHFLGRCCCLVVEYQTFSWEFVGLTWSWTQSTASNMLIFCILRPTDLQQNTKWVLVYLVWAIGWQPNVTDFNWFGRWCVYMLAVPFHGSSCLIVWAMNGHVMCCGSISSHQSASTFEIVKCYWSQVWLM